jgi:hypothetical protein
MYVLKILGGGKVLDTVIQCCESRMFIPDPDLYPSRFPDPTTTTKEGGGKFCCPTFFVAKNITKFKIVLFLNTQRKKM